MVTTPSKPVKWIKRQKPTETTCTFFSKGCEQRYLLWHSVRLLVTLKKYSLFNVIGWKKNFWRRSYLPCLIFISFLICELVKSCYNLSLQLVWHLAVCILTIALHLNMQPPHLFQGSWLKGVVFKPGSTLATTKCNVICQHTVLADQICGNAHSSTFSCEWCNFTV